MGLRDRLRRAEQAASGFLDRAVLEDGTVIHIGPGERLDALLALMDERPHPLHVHHSRLAPVQDDPTLFDLAALFHAFEAGRDREEDGS